MSDDKDAPERNTIVVSPFDTHEDSEGLSQLVSVHFVMSRDDALKLMDRLWTFIRETKESDGCNSLEIDCSAYLAPADRDWIPISWKAPEGWDEGENKETP